MGQYISLKNLYPVLSFKINSKTKIVNDLNKKNDYASNEKRRVGYDF